ncbi:MAG: class I SAM-dependent methyltransferase, partial [Frankia sp.]
MPGDLRYRNPGNVDLLRIIDLPPGRALDCGCGAGDNARLLRAVGWSVTGVTLDVTEQAAASAFCDEVRLANLSDGLPFVADRSVDLVVLSHVLEHLADPAALLAEAARVLTPTGVVAVALPNIAHFRQRAAFARGRFDYTQTGPMDATHLRFFTVSTAARLLRDSGFQIVTEAVAGGLPWWRLRAVVPAERLARADRWLVRRRPNLLAWQSLFVARPVEARVDPPAQRRQYEPQASMATIGAVIPADAPESTTARRHPA